MTTIQTTPAIVLNGPLGPESRKYPVLAYLEHFIADYWDVGKDHGHSDYHTENFTVITPHHEHFKSESGNKHAATQAGEKFYTSAFSKYKHVTHRVIAIEKKNGWDLNIQFDLFANLAAASAKSGSKVRDQEGSEWDIKLPMFCYFDVIGAETSNPHNFKLHHVRFIVDTGFLS